MVGVSCLCGNGLTIKESIHMKANLTQGLTEHLKLVSKVGEYYSDKLGLDSELKKCVYYGCLTHDVGKAVNTFQEYITDQFDFIVDDCKPNFNGPYHHEISWLVCQHFDSVFKFNFDQNSYRKIVLNSIYWHHGQPIDDKFEVRDSCSKISEMLTNEDFIVVRDYVAFLFGVELTNNLDDVKDVKTPKFFEDSTIDINAKILTVRSILISSDRFVSSLTPEQFERLSNDFDMYIESYFYNNFQKISYSCPEHYDINRFKVQEICALDSLNSKTVVSKSPAGFGKTLQGLLRNFNSGGKLYWVCPRNAVANSVYYSILQELKSLNVNISVELFLTGERKESFNATSEVCSSRIIVTNFDNIFNPFYKNNYAGKAFDVLNSDIIFDEFHEIVNDEAIFAMFGSFMYSRNVLQNKKTFLLSATPMSMDYIWSRKESNTTNLPSNDKHFKSFHNKKYEIKFLKDKALAPLDLERSLYKFNSIKDTQNNYQNGHICFHSNFTDDHFKERFDLLYQYFGKNSDKEYRQNVFSAPIIGASFDISFDSAVIYPESPEADIQVIGRVNRWGLEDNIILYMIQPDSRERSNKKSLDVRYDYNLTNLWYDKLKARFENVEFNLDELYNFYNEFNLENKNQLKDYLDNNLSNSLGKLSKYYHPIKYPVDSKFEKTNGKSLRNSDGQYNIVVRENNNWMHEAFSLDFVQFQGLLKDNTQEVKDLKKIIKNTLGNCPEFDYSSTSRSLRNMKELGQKKILNWAKNPMTPFPINSWTYNNKTGLNK